MALFEDGDLGFLASVLVDAVGACAAAAWVARGPRWPVLRALGAATILAVGWLAKLRLMVAAGLDGFGGLHVIYLDLVVAMPLAGLTFVAVRRSRLVTWTVAPLVVVVLTLGAYASFVEPHGLSLERADVALNPRRAGDDPVRVGVLADLQTEHVGDHERAAVARLMAARPDLILLPGDIHQGSDRALHRELRGLRQLLGGLRAPAGVWFVPGDMEDVAKARTLLQGTGIRLLVGATAAIRVRDRRLTLAGIDEARRDPESGQRTATALGAAPGGSDVRILLTHRPDALLWLRPATRVDLVIAGHTHGGQVQLPGIGPPILFSRLPRRVGAGGLHSLTGRRIYISRGVGMERGQAPGVRFGARPEVSVLTLR